MHGNGALRLTPGQYIVSATVGAVSPADLPGYARSYFPGTPNPAQGQFIAIGPQQDFGGIDFSLSRTRTVRVTGKSLNAAGEQKTAHANEECSKVEGRLDARVAGSANHDATDRVVGPPSDR